MHIREKFLDAGIACGHIDGDTHKDERDKILAQVRSGELQGISNCMVLTEGWDMPQLSCCTLARPTKSLGLYLQMAGRVLRPSEGKTRHPECSTTLATCTVTDWWTRTTTGVWIPTSRIQDREAQRKAKEPKKTECPQCKAVYTGRRSCPECGFEPKRQPEEVEVVDGELEEITAAKGDHGREARAVRRSALHRS